jgi:hypothetical protein
MYLYKEQFPVGSEVEIADRNFLEAFASSWKLHHALDPGQIAYAGQTSSVRKVGFYHGGDVLYELDAIPGIWHEACLRSAQRANDIVKGS